MLHDELDAKYGFGLPWWVYALAILALCFGCAYRGIVISVRFLMTMGVRDRRRALPGRHRAGAPRARRAQRGRLQPGQHSFPTGFFLAIVLSIFAFTGFESAAAVGEESRDPHRLVPTAIVGSLVLLGSFYVSAPGVCRSAGAPTT